MIQKELKIKLLNSGHFKDNEYLSKYCELIESNLSTKQEKYKTQKHHILPKCYFKLVGQKINNSKTNLINLSYKHHILAHYYLCLCTEGKFKALLFNGLVHLLNSKSLKLEDFKKLDLDKYQRLYEEWKINSSLYLKGVSHGPMDESTKRKISESNKGKQGSHKGKKFSPETCNKISRSKTGCKYSDQARENMSKGRKGISGYSLPPKSKETKLKISLARKGKKNTNPHPNKGIPISEETKKKISLANKSRKRNPMSEESKQKISKSLKGRKQSSQCIEHKCKPIRCVELDISYLSIKEAIEITGFSSISNAVKHNKTAGGYHWEYINEKE